MIDLVTLGAACFVLHAVLLAIVWFDPRMSAVMSAYLLRRARSLAASRKTYKKTWNRETVNLKDTLTYSKWEEYFPDPDLESK